MTVVGHLGGLPLEELLTGCAGLFAIGFSTLRAMAKAKVSRHSRGREL